MRKIKLPTDRTVFSTDNNGYAGNERDETLVDQNLWDSEIATDDRIPDGVGRIATLSGAFSGTSRTDADNPAPPGRGPVLYIPCAFFQPAIKYFTARHVSMSEFGNEGICP